MGVSKLDESLTLVSKLPTLEFVYTNWKGETANRKVMDPNIWYGESKYHSGRQWLLHGYCTSRDDFRDFALKDIIAFI